jgi:2,4-dienoyl-CoA reductase-like NADH-dependent reductase (Old Yellow Enzyme family)
MSISNSSSLFSSFRLRELEFKNRIFVSPMCQYSSIDGMPTDWHLVHLGSRAVGGAALVCVEATAVSPMGRISPGDSGIWGDQHVEGFARITKFILENGSVPAVQLAHAGRKASTDLPWNGGKPLDEGRGGWRIMGPSSIAFGAGYQVPREMTGEDIDAVVSQFSAAARRALSAGFQVVELHMAHGYLMNEFLSPLSNHRKDEYGGSLANRMRLPLRVAGAVREIWPGKWPVFVRISATDWKEGGWDLGQSIELSKALLGIGIDLIDCSSSGNAADAKIAVGPGYQVPFAEAIRKEVGIATGAVGMITEARQAEEIVSLGKGDVVLLARGMLRDPYWALHAARELGVEVEWAKQYLRGKLK